MADDSPTTTNPTPANTAPTNSTSAPPEAQPQTPPDASAASIRTYHGDVADVVKQKKVSLTDIALARDKRRREREEKTPAPVVAAPVSRTRLVIIIVAVVLILAGVGTLTVVVLTPDTPDTVPVPQTLPSIITTNTTRFLDTETFDRSDALAAAEALIDETNESLGSITDIVFTHGTGATGAVLNARSFLSMFETNAPLSLSRTFEPEYVFGIHAFDNNQPFIIFKTRFFDNAFAGMLTWEETLGGDLPFLVRRAGPSHQTPTGTRQFFADVVVRNRDVRVLTDETGAEHLLYSFPDENTLVMTTNRNTLIEVFTRLTTARFSQ